MFYGCTGGQTRLGVDYMKRTGPAVARQLKKHGQVRFQTIAMRRSAGCLCKWHTLLMALGNAVTGKKLLHGAVTTTGGRPTSNLTKDGPPKSSTKWKRSLTGRPTYWERPLTRLLGDDWLPKVKACKSWTEWRSLTMELERVWHAMLSLKPPELTTGTWDAPVEREERPRDDSDPWLVP